MTPRLAVSYVGEQPWIMNPRHQCNLLLAQWTNNGEPNLEKPWGIPPPQVQVQQGLCNIVISSHHDDHNQQRKIRNNQNHNILNAIVTFDRYLNHGFIFLIPYLILVHK